MIKFGPSGNSESFFANGYKTTEQSAFFVKNMGLDLFEYSFGRGVNMSESKALLIGEAFKKADVEISVHAPYYINFANENDEMAEKSIGYLLESAKALKLLGGKRCVFHPASQGKAEREKAVYLTEERLKKLTEYVYLNNLEDLMFCPETMGKIGQIGTVEEITRFCKIDKIFTPTLDFGHINSREHGSLKTDKDYSERLEYMISELSLDKMKEMHVHFSKIQYSAGGEVKHLTFADTIYGPEFPPLARVIKKLGLQPYIVSESAGTQAEDALEMKRIYNGLE